MGEEAPRGGSREGDGGRSGEEDGLVSLARRFLKFGIVGFLGFVVDTIFLYLGIHVFGLGRIPAAFFAFPFAVTTTWLGNRFFTFRDAPPQPMAIQWARFAAVCAVGIVINRGTYSLLVSAVPLVYEHPVLGLVGGSAAGMFFNFFVSKALVFRR